VVASSAGQHLHHGFDHVAVWRHCGGHAAGLWLNGAANFYKARLYRPGAAVVVVVLALAQAPFAGAPAHVSVAGVLGVYVQAHHQARCIDHLVKSLAPFGQQEFVVQVVARRGGLLAVKVFYFALDHQHKGLGSAHPPQGVGQVQSRMRGVRVYWGVCAGDHGAILGGRWQHVGLLRPWTHG
jgi:cytochrome c1